MAAKSLREDAKKCIMIVDDNEDVRWLFAEFVSQYGYTSIVAGDGQDAIKKLLDSGQRPPDLILIDCTMPAMDSVDFVREFRVQQKNGRFEKTVIVAMSHYGTDEPSVQSILPLVNSFVAKPRGYEDFVGFIEKFVEQ